MFMRSAGALGLNLQADDQSNGAILRAAVYRASAEIDVIIAELDRRENGAEIPLNYALAAIRERLDLALLLSEGIFDPDDPWETSGAEAYHANRKAKHGMVEGSTES
jgi:hypothetical protein